MWGFFCFIFCYCWCCCIIIIFYVFLCFFWRGGGSLHWPVDPFRSFLWPCIGDGAFHIMWHAVILAWIIEEVVSYCVMERTSFLYGIITEFYNQLIATVLDHSNILKQGHRIRWHTITENYTKKPKRTRFLYKMSKHQLYPLWSFISLNFANQGQTMKRMMDNTLQHTYTITSE